MMEADDRDIHIDTKFGKFYIGQAVTYSVYPLVKDGLGMVTREGILTVGKHTWTLSRMKMALKHSLGYVLGRFATMLLHE